MAFPLGALAGIGGSLLGGLFGGGNRVGSLAPEQQRLYDFLFRRAKALKAYGNSPAMSGVDERQAVAAARGSAGEILRQKREQGYAALGPEGSPATGDFLGSLGGAEAGILSGIDFNALMNSLNSRRDAKYGGSAQIAAMAGGPAAGQRYAEQQPDLGALFGQLAGAVSQQQASQSPRPSDLRPISGVVQNGLPSYSQPPYAPADTGGGTYNPTSSGSAPYPYYLP